MQTASSGRRIPLANADAASPPIQDVMAPLERRRYPAMIILDVTNVCNLQCVHCPQPSIQARDDFRIAHLPDDVFRSLTDQLSECTEPCLLRFVGDGEPMLHPDILDMIEQVKRRTTCVVNLTTNGTRLSKDAASRLLTSGIEMIDISLDALTKPVYDRIRKGGKYEQVIGNVLSLLDLRGRTASPTKILVSFVRQDDNEMELETFLKFWEPLVDFVTVRNLHSANQRVKVLESVRRNEASQRERFPCSHLWKRLVVDFKGQIKFCPTDS